MRWAGEESHEAYISAEHPQASQEPRVSPQDVDTSRKGDLEVAPSQGSPSSFRVSTWTPSSMAIGRISDRATFVDLRRPSGQARCGPVTVSWVEGAVPGKPRVAYAVSRKVGGAVERNLVRRRLRAIFAETASVLPAGSYLVSAAPQASRSSFTDLRISISRAIEVLAADGRR